MAQSEAAAEVQAIQKPKRAVSAYWLFTNKVREEVTKESKEKNNGKANMGDIAKAMSARWQALSEAEKKEFEEKAAEDKQRFEKEMEAYKEASDPAGTLRKKYAHLIPKKPMTAYFLFSQDAAQREKATAALKEAGVEANNKQLASKLGEMWKLVSAEEKAPFEERYKREQAEFLTKQKEWQATPEFDEIEKAASKQAELQKAAEAEEETAKPAKGGKRSRSVPKESAKKESVKGKAEKDKVEKGKAEKGKEEKGEGKEETTPAKRAKKAAALKEQPAQDTSIDADVLAEADKAGLASMLKNLAARPEVAALGKPSRVLLDALKKSNGLVNPAKRALVEAGGA
mmetsp:Transcript_11296/g.30174  ORF Transcript_11296/g.30174 Transcript_11296/m.30174 type:complete len:343 (-) Transcript_11296:89-1117(-)